MKCVLTIAGSDCSGGAGIQADMKTMQANGVYAMSAVTALTAQNTTGVYGIMEASPEFLENQLNCIFEDIFPDAVKIGMVSSARLIEVIADSLVNHRLICPESIQRRFYLFFHYLDIIQATGLTGALPESVRGGFSVYAVGVERTAILDEYDVCVMVRFGAVVARVGCRVRVVHGKLEGCHKAV